MSAAGSFSRSAATSPPHVPTTARRPAPRWRKVRRHRNHAGAPFAKERLEALLGSGRSKPPAGKVAVGAAAVGPRKVALIVGNGAYRNVQPLANPPRDARLIASTFRELGFATVTLAPDLTRDKFFAALHEFGVEAEKADWAVVYYAGHGMEIGGVNYLIPTDARLTADQRRGDARPWRWSR